MECPIKKTIQKSDEVIQKSLKEKWGEKVDLLFDKGKERLDKTALKIKHNTPEWANEYLFRIQEYAKDIGEITQNFTNTKSVIYAQSAKVKKYLETLSEKDSKELFNALDGDLEPTKLPAHVRPLYEKFRAIIDNNAKELIKAGALDKNYAIKDYIKRYYTDAVQQKRASAKLAIDKLHKRKNMSYDERIARGMLEDSSFAVSNTLAEQRVQLAKANALKMFADKFGKDEMFDGAVRISDETIGGGVKKYGALGGKYVPKEIADAVIDAGLVSKELNIFSNAYFKIIDHIKVNVTVKNPFTHFYNVASNLTLSYLHGDFGELTKVTRMIGTDEFKTLVNKADELGLGSQLNDLEGLRALKSDKDVGVIERIFKELYFAEGSKAGDFARNAYAWEDKIFKLARFKKNLEKLAKQKGIKYNDFAKFSKNELQEAMKDAQWGYVDYSTHLNGTLKLLDKSGVMPFLHYSVKSTPMVLKTILKNPERFILFQAAMMGAGASSWLGDNEKENLAKPKWAESGAFANLFGIKSWVKLPMDGWYLNAGRAVPGFRFDGFDKFEFSGGFVKGALNVAGGKSAMGYNNESDDDTLWERVQSRTFEMMKAYFPPMTFGRYGQNLGAAIGNKIAPNTFDAPKDYNKDDLSVGEILARGVGVREFNLKKEYKNEANKVKKAYKNENNTQKRRELERKFNTIKSEAKKSGVTLDVSLLGKREIGGFGGSGGFGDKKLKIELL